VNPKGIHRIDGRLDSCRGQTPRCCGPYSKAQGCAGSLQPYQRLQVAPANLRGVVDVALGVAGQPQLIHAGPEHPGEIGPPALGACWERTLAALPDPLSGEPRRPTFDSRIAGGRDDVLPADLEHPLVAHSTRLLCGAIWRGAHGSAPGLRRPVSLAGRHRRRRPAGGGASSPRRGRR